MSLPVIPLPTGAVTVCGHTVEVRGLARAEVHLMGKIGQEKGTTEAEAVMIAAGCGVTQVAAAEWLSTTPTGIVDAVLQKIMELSGMDGLGKEQPEG